MGEGKTQGPDRLSPGGAPRQLLELFLLCGGVSLAEWNALGAEERAELTLAGEALLQRLASMVAAEISAAVGLQTPLPGPGAPPAGEDQVLEEAAGHLLSDCLRRAP